jgi:hypothetical protein
MSVVVLAHEAGELVVAIQGARSREHLLGLQKLELPPEITSLTITLFAVGKSGGDHTRQRLRAYTCRQARASRPHQAVVGGQLAPGIAGDAHDSVVQRGVGVEIEYRAGPAGRDRHGAGTRCEVGFESLLRLSHNRGDRGANPFVGHRLVDGLASRVPSEVGGGGMTGVEDP